VYLAVVVVLAAAIAGAAPSPAASEIRRATGVPARTVGRWLSWWRAALISGAAFAVAAARFAPSLAALAAREVHGRQRRRSDRRGDAVAVAVVLRSVDAIVIIEGRRATRRGWRSRAVSTFS
jgi:hypothetical protein